MNLTLKLVEDSVELVVMVIDPVEESMLTSEADISNSYVIPDVGQRAS